MKKRTIFLVISLAIIPPFINFVVGLNSPNNIVVIGDTATWVQFFGSYIGGVLTAFIGFIAMERSSHENAKNIQISSKQKEITTLEQTLSNCVSLFDYSRVGTIALYLRDPVKYDNVLQRLDDYDSKITITANAWGVIYSNSTKREIQEFQDAYVDCVNKLKTTINQVSEKIVLLKHIKEDVGQRKQLISEITNIIRRTEEYNTSLSRLFSAAQRWIASEKQELLRLQNS